MDPELIKFLSGLGQGGILAGALWIMLKGFIKSNADQVKETQTQMCERISSLEEGQKHCEQKHKECEDERRKIAGELLDVLKFSPVRRATNRTKQNRKR